MYKSPTKQSISELKESLKIKKNGIPPGFKCSTVPSSEEQNKIKLDLATNYTPFVQLNFVKKLNGFRPGEIHLIMGRPGKGKSTLNRTIINSFVTNNKNCFLILTEEFCDQYITQCNLDPKYANNLMAISEKEQLKPIAGSSDHAYDKISKLVAYIEVLLEDSNFKPDSITFDNMHSSSIIDENDKESLMHLLSCFEALGAKYSCPIIIYAHVDTKQKIMPYSEISIRGNRVTPIKAQNVAALYLSGETDGSEPRLCFHWLKSRNQGQVNNSKFAFIYDKSTKMYKKDFEIDHNTFSHYWLPKNIKVDTHKAEEQLKEGIDKAENKLFSSKGKSFFDPNDIDPKDMV